MTRIQKPEASSSIYNMLRKRKTEITEFMRREINSILTSFVLEAGGNNESGISVKVNELFLLYSENEKYGNGMMLRSA